MAALLVASVTGCTDDGSSDAAPPSQAGLVDPGYWRERQDSYLDFASERFDPRAPVSLIAAAEHARRAGTTLDTSEVTVDALQETFDTIDNFDDTGDFLMVYLANLWYGYRDDLPDDVSAAIAERMRSFKYWYTDPQPEGVTDNRYYWSENHQILFHSAEYLAGQALPDEEFSSDGNTGAWHRDRARGFIEDWLDERVRYGFTEWHADGYYQKTFDGLITIVEWADDPELVERASMVLDLLLFDMALHLHEGNQGATHGRSYMNSKSKATDSDGFDLNKLIWNDTDVDYTGKAPDGATLMARAQRYRVPAVLLRVGTSEEEMVDREHMGIALDPAAPVDPGRTEIDGHSFSDPDEVAFWWGRGAHTSWQILPMTFATIDELGLWDYSFFAPLRPLRDATGPDADAQRALASSLEPMIAYPSLTEVDTYTYRTDDVMLSTAQSYRPGRAGHQQHISQATLDEDAVVFTTHPTKEPERGPEWTGGDGYWIGGVLPRAAQQGALSISLYAPVYANPGPPLDQFHYLDYTHAYFPQERFDEIVERDGWTFGRRGDSYVALWSWRSTEWRTYDHPDVFTNGLTEPFDLVAPGGPDNVWLTQVGDASAFSDFAAFQDQVLAGTIDVTPRPAADGIPGGFDVRYDSPTEGTVAFGSTGPLQVDDADVPLASGLRYDNPWTRAEIGAERFEIADDQGSLVLDFAQGERTTAGGAAAPDR